MTTRERSLALGLLTAAVLGGLAFLYYKTFVAPLQDLDASIISLQQDVDNKEERVDRITQAKGRLERWRQLSLPSDLAFSQREYEIYLSGLLQDSGFPPTRQIMPKTAERSSQVIAGKGPIYVRLPFTITAKTSLASLVEMLERFYRTPLLHQVKRISIGRPSAIGTQAQSGELDVHLTVEALIVAGAENRQDLLPGVTKRLAALDALAALQGAPTGLGIAMWAAGPTGPLGPRVLAQPPRQYATIAKKNIFLGSTMDRPEVAEVARFVHLTDITHDSEKPCEAFLYDRYNGTTTRLRAETGFDTFWVRDSEGETLVRGKVARLDGRELIFQVQSDDTYYSMHVGENLAQALKHRLTADQLKVLGLGAVAEKVSTEAKPNGDN
jgi:hypothetical protein